ncbi:CBS domain-containing protein [Methanothermobacter tenebrarum]|uniref:CBS domain-containing protein n=1 Tax=Methanothermobacter tenebrarum TaxID=680118 RepID=A0A328PAW4_9EURY|nr:CBS domain-containing protein [Methanothermobacter tenebrarum]MBC7100532.1 CBS domain-containing protein [Methanobacteriales archaeon]MBC7117985.1 CBS domain-containing protein [Methanobacteriaceae archaeon]NPV64215.1 CBS domain-containing protein [Methanobacteriaceae archaeon]RAO79978.1 CBS domain-containing protein [Methanothermobacter tenebrarum]
MTPDPITVKPSEDVVFAFEKLMKHKISALPVEDQGKLLGIVTATDLGHNLILDNYRLGTRVEEVMVKDVATISPNETLKDAIEKMSEYGEDEGIINQLVVLEDDKIVGIISDGDIIKVLKEL